MADRRTVVLALLAAAVVVVAAGITAGWGLERLADARLSATRSEERIGRIRKTLPTAADVDAARTALRSEIDAASSRFYAAEEMNPYLFGTIVKQKLSAMGISVQRYQVVDVKGTSYVEYSATGSARSIVTFLRDVSSSAKLWTIPAMSLTFHEGSDKVDAVVRIGYAVLDQKNP